MRLPRWLRPRPAPARVAPQPDLTWVDEWVANVRDYVHVREEERLFIKRPNQAFKLNPQGARLMARLLAGEPLGEVLAPYGPRADVRRDTERFLLDLRRLLADGLEDTYESPAVEKVPFGLGFSRLPVLSEVALTYRCNAACVFCYAGCNCTANPVDSAREMTTDEVRRVLTRLREEADVPSVSFTGGEATLRTDLPALVACARDLGMRVNLITNGIACASRRLVASLADAGLHSAQVSLEGTQAAVHEAVTRAPGSFARTLQGVQNLRAAGLVVHTNTTLCRLNLEDAQGLPTFVRETLALDRFSMNLVIPTGSAPVHEGVALRYSELPPHLERLLARSRQAGVRLEWYSPTPMCIFNPIVHGLGNKGCAACDGLVSVGADGQVLPCASYDQPLGSLLERPFAEVWGSAAATRFREKRLAPAGCRECEQFAICNGACPLYWRHQGPAELETRVGAGAAPAEVQE